MPHNIVFEFEDDTLMSCEVQGIPLSPEEATEIFRLDEEHGPGYIPRGKPGTRLNALNFLRWDAYRREPEIFGDPGPFEEQEDFREDVVY